MGDRPKRTLQELADIVEQEGLGYAIEDYIGADDIADEAMREKWKAAAEAIRAIREMLGPYAPDADD